jgi:hypothetical protein
VVAAAALAGGAWWWTHRSVDSETVTVQADGSTLVDGQGVHVVAPAGWTVVPTATVSAMAKAAQPTTQSDPQLAGAVQELASAQGANALRFVAYGHPVGGTLSAANANVLVTDLPVTVADAVSSSSAELTSRGATDIHESEVSTGSGSGEELTFQIRLTLPEGGSVTLNSEQVFVSKGSEVGILTLETDAPSDPAFPGIISSFRLT